MSRREVPFGSFGTFGRNFLPGFLTPFILAGEVGMTMAFRAAAQERDSGERVFCETKPTDTTFRGTD
jgi:hypothetical protein